MQEGYEAYLLLVIQMKGVDRFEPTGRLIGNLEKPCRRRKRQECIFWLMTAW